MPRRLAFAALGIAAAAAALVRHGAGMGRGRHVPGGILVADANAYDAVTHRFLLGSLVRSIAADVAANSPLGARVLEVGCGPGRLAIRLAREYGLDVTGLDLDAAMIERARANAHDAGAPEGGPTFVVGDVAALPFPDASFDVVVSTLSMHHWADVTAGLAEIGRVLKPDGRAFIWDFRGGRMPLHPHMPDPLEHAHGSALRVLSARPWRWPWKLQLTHRIELVPGQGNDRAQLDSGPGQVSPPSDERK